LRSIAFETETRLETSKPNPSLETPLLMIIHMCSLVLQKTYPVSNYSPMKNKNKFCTDQVKSWTKWIFETFLLLVYFNVFWLYFCVSFLSFCHEINSGAIYCIIISA